jgi:hypothetical protein
VSTRRNRGPRINHGVLDDAREVNRKLYELLEERDVCNEEKHLVRRGRGACCSQIGASSSPVSYSHSIRLTQA